MHISVLNGALWDTEHDVHSGICEIGLLLNYKSKLTDINSLGPSDTIWRQRSGSTLARLMACCLTAPNHYLNQCWLIISKVEWHSSEGKFTRDTSAINHWIIWKSRYLNCHSNFPGANVLRLCVMKQMQFNRLNNIREYSSEIDIVSIADPQEYF